jgi:hypothetical protein
MSPEAPGNLVVLDLRFQNHDLTGSIERISPPQEQLIDGPLRVRFDTRTKEKGFEPVTGGVAWVSRPTGYVRTAREPVGTVPCAGGEDFYYNHVAYGEGLMLVLILPEGYTLADSHPVPRGAKQFNGRIATYFKPQGSFGDDTRVTWRLRRFDKDLKSEVERIHRRILDAGKTPSHFGVVVDDEDPMKEKRPSVWDYWWIAMLAALTAIGLLALDIYAGKSLPSTVQNLI